MRVSFLYFCIALTIHYLQFNVGRNERRLLQCKLSLCKVLLFGLLIILFIFLFILFLT